MASIKKLVSKATKNISYKVQIRRPNLKSINKTFKTKKEAEKFVKTLEGNDHLLDVLGDPLLNDLTLASIIDEFLLQYNRKDPVAICRLKWWKEQYGDFKLVNFKMTEVRRALQTISSSGKTGATLNRYKAILSTVFEFTKEQYGIDVNPCRGIKSKPESRGRVRFLTDDERKRLLFACKDAPWNKLYLLVLMALTTGGRRSELLGLTWKDIDFQNQIAYLHDTKNGDRRSLPLTENVIVELKKYRGIGLLFPSTTKPDKPFYYRKSWLASVKRAGITDFRFHDLRHSFCSMLAQNGASLIEIADAAGHRSMAMTKRYSHLCITHKENLINRVFSNI